MTLIDSKIARIKPRLNIPKIIKSMYVRIITMLIERLQDTAILTSHECPSLRARFVSRVNPGQKSTKEVLKREAITEIRFKLDQGINVTNAKEGREKKNTKERSQAPKTIICIFILDVEIVCRLESFFK